MFLFKTLTVILCLGSTAVVDQCNTGSEKAECLLQTAKDLMDDVNGDASLLETEDDDPESLLETQDELRMTAITDKKTIQAMKKMMKKKGTRRPTQSGCEGNDCKPNHRTSKPNPKAWE